MADRNITRIRKHVTGETYLATDLVLDLLERADGTLDISVIDAAGVPASFGQLFRVRPGGGHAELHKLLIDPETSGFERHGPGTGLDETVKIDWP